MSDRLIDYLKLRRVILVDANGNIVSSGAITYTQSTITVTNVSQQFLAANASRKYLLIQNNDGAGICYLVYGAAATTTLGVVIPPVYGAVEEATPSVSNQTVNIIGSIASNANVILIEGN